MDTFHRDILDCKGDNWPENHLHDSYLPGEAWEDMFIANRSARWVEEIRDDRPWHLFVSFVVELIDVGQAVCEAAGLPPRHNVDARSFLAVAAGRAVAHRENAVISLHSWNAIRTERYKFVDNFNDIPELYDLADDPGETKNVADTQRTTAAGLRRRLRDRLMEGWCNR